MRSLIRKKLKEAGLPPGTLVYVGDKKIEKVRVIIIDYDQTSFQEKVGHHPEPSRVPIVNLKTREMKILKFG